MSMMWRVAGRALRAAVPVLVMAVPSHAEPVTFSADVAPLLFRHCATCHRPGGASRIPFLTFRDARTHARQIAQMTQTGLMPPWQPEPGWGTFDGDRRLRDDEVAVFQRWVDDGLLEGDAAALPPAPSFPSDWQLGPPDLVIAMPEYSLRADGPDMFRNFVLPVPELRTRYVRAWEFRPGNPAVVHHATMQVDATGASRAFDADDPASGYEGLIAPSARAPDGFFLDWAPGHRPQVAVPGTAWTLQGGSDIVMMLHLRPSGRTEPVRASLALYFTDVPPQRTPVMLRLTRQDLDIPAAASRYTVEDRYVLPVDVELHTVQPHAHYLAREMTAVATRPDGTSVRLLRIRDWDFNWQDVYRYAEPVRLPAGTTVAMSISYDNTESNPRNPNRPPIAVEYGQQTSDEMAEMWFQVLPVRPSDRAALVDSLYRKVLPEEIRGRRRMLRREPSSIALRDDLALMLAEAGDLASAEREFRATLALRPDSAAARFNVGMAALMRGARAEAERLFASAIDVEPAHGPSHFQLGLLRQADGDLRRAADHLSAAAAARPADPDVLLAAGAIAAMQGDDGPAIQRLRAALDLRPGWANAEAALAEVLSSRVNATPAERATAVTLAEQANARTSRGNAAFLDILAGALAAAGDVRRAVDVAREALAVAEHRGDASTASRMRERIAEWESRR
jgi:tetratricopeptide (TPR) repeat protein